MKGRQAVRHPDGPRDQSIDISHLSVKSMAAKRRAYARWTIPGGKITTAAGQKLSFDLGRDSHAGYANLEWKYDGNVSVAKTGCQRCREINSCRERGTPAFICLVRADDSKTREDGTSQCAYCSSVTSNLRCNAIKAIGKAKTCHPASKGKKRSRKETLLSSESDTDNEESTQSSEDEDDDAVRSKSGRIIRPVDRYPAPQSIRRSKKDQKRASKEPNTVHEKRVTTTELVEVTIYDPNALVKKEMGENDDSHRASTEAESRYTNDVLKDKEQETGVDRARKIRQGCIKTASQLLALELAELEAELKGR